MIQMSQRIIQEGAFKAQALVRVCATCYSELALDFWYDVGPPLSLLESEAFVQHHQI